MNSAIKPQIVDFVVLSYGNTHRRVVNAQRFLVGMGYTVRQPRANPRPDAIHPLGTRNNTHASTEKA
ncbi:hypothetical protein [Caballeronia udeis]|uniref:hypothetical protein n=1 Tax=Caballeronia udeis TaxID=1232866 RepID=UPI0007819126|nr:hypothetical protein [Caballeronia udeis]